LVMYKTKVILDEISSVQFFLDGEIMNRKF
jgi:hypothetical protein